MNTPVPVVLMVLVCVPRGVFDAADALYARYEQYDALLVARCEAMCWETNNKNSCMNSCLSKPFDKPGRCPKNEAVLSPFDAVCLNVCIEDSQCYGLTKCCRHSCGVTCQNPEELLSAVGVPNIPYDVKVAEALKKRTIRLEWKSKQSETFGTIVYLIEERHHAGRNFIEENLSEWTLCARTNKPSHVLKNFVKPGRWYQFRVAAVNQNGTKGFSKNSPTFTVSTRPKPPKAPQNLTVTALWSCSNGTIFGELRWSPPRSDLPIQKYKVFWSRRLHGVRALDSVLVHQQVVPKEQTKFLLKNLQPNSLYFLQVQALAQFGKTRMKGQKSGLVLNTTNYTNVTTNDFVTPKTDNEANKIEDLRVQKMDWFQEGLRAKITWKPKSGTIRYTVSLWAGSCNKSLKSRNFFKFAATTKVPHFDLYDLQFSCRYRVGVLSISEDGKKFVQDTFISFTTPSCQDFIKINKKVKCI